MPSTRGQRMDFDAAGQLNCKLSDKVGIIPIVGAFGDSGDVFNHGPWRAFFRHLGNYPDVLSQIVALGAQYLLRAKQEKIENSGDAPKYTLNLTSVDFDKLQAAFNIKKSAIYAFKILFPTSATRVEGDALTMERFKCAIRPVMVGPMMTVKRFPATSVAIGFASMGDELRFHNTLMPLKDEEQKKAWKEAGRKDEDLKAWVTLLTVAQSHNVKSWISVTAMTSASISQKEIYEECETEFPGTIFWAGIHCIMTDVSNKRKSVEVPADKRANFENSNFYGDFKRKQLSRSIEVTKTEAYLVLLECCVPLMSSHLRSSTGVTEREIAVIDLVKRDADRRFARAVEIDEEKGISTSSAQDMAEIIKLKQEQFLAMSADEFGKAKDDE